MATDLQPRPSVPKYEAFVEQQLGKVRKRIRLLDIGRSLMMLAIVTLGYFLAMAVFNLATGGGEDPVWTAVRLGGFGLYVLIVGFYLVQLCARLYRRINPFYAARQLEETLEDPKNSVINWLDLRDQEEVPGAIRNAVGLKAARELKQADPERAVEAKSNWIIGSMLLGLVLGILVLFAMGPNQFGSLLGRVFAPFRDVALASRAEITLLKPASGDVAIPLQQRLEFQARIDGRFPKVNEPGAPRLLYRYQQNDAFAEAPLDEAVDGTWGITFLPDQIQNGLWYKIAAGDAETPVYQVKVQAPAQAGKFEVTYKFRPYLKLPELTERYPHTDAVVPHIKGHRGTDIIMLVRTNRELREGRVEVESNGAKSDVFGEVLKDEPRSFQVKWTLQHSGVFRVYFMSKDGEPNIDRGVAYNISVLDDETPRVVLTAPGKDISLPSNGTLQLEGDATDDLGIKALALRMKIVEGDGKGKLSAKAFREGKSLQFDDGTFPPKLDYKDFVVLDQLKNDKGEAITVKSGMVVEYWLEATDNSDFPNAAGNIGRSASYKVAILDPAKDKDKDELKKERDKTKDDQKKFEKQQDAKHAKDNQERNQAKKDGKNDEAKPDPQKEKEDKEREQKLDDIAKKLQDELDKQKEKGDGKGAEPPKGANKPGDAGKENDAANKEAKPDNPDQAGAKKDGDKGNSADKAAEAKDKGEKGDKGDKQNGNQSADAKGPGQNQPQQEPKSKDAKGDKDPQKAQGDKGVTKEAPGKEGQGEAKGADKAGGDGQKSEAKGGAGPGKKDDKGGGEPGLAKGGDAEQPKAENKDGKQGGPMGQQGQPAMAKNDKGGGPQGNAKDAKGGQGKDPGQARDDPQPKDWTNATAEDLQKLKDELERQEQPGEKLDDLRRMAKKAKDPAVRKAAEELVREMAPKEAQAKGPKEGKGPDQAPMGEPKQGEGQMGQPGGEAKPGQPDAGQQTGKGGGEGPQEDATAKGKGKMGGSGQNSAGIGDEGLKPQAANSEFGKKGGELQLEKFKDRVTPEMLKKAGISDAEWLQFLQDAQAHNDSLQKKSKPGVNQKAGSNQLGSILPQEVKLDPNGAVDPLQVNRPALPPEFRGPQERFTTRPKQ